MNLHRVRSYVSRVFHALCDLRNNMKLFAFLHALKRCSADVPLAEAVKGFLFYG